LPQGTHDAQEPRIIGNSSFFSEERLKAHTRF
jgi:hypothetical protein